MTDLRLLVVRDRDLAEAHTDDLAERALVLGFDQQPTVLDLNAADPAYAPGGGRALPGPVDGVDHMGERPRWR